MFRFLFTFVLLHGVLFGKPVHVTSPDGRIQLEFFFRNRTPYYSVSYLHQPVLKQSLLGVTFNGTTTRGNARIAHTYRDTRAEQYTLIVGKAKHIHTEYNELIVSVEFRDNKTTKLNVVIRVFNDGIAFRYQWPVQQGLDTLRIEQELTSFLPAANAGVTALFLPGYTSSHEGLYTEIAYDALYRDSLIASPLLLHDINGKSVAITEASLSRYPGMYLIKHGDVLEANLSPLPGKQTKAISALPFESPWRVVLISERVGGLIESNAITTLNKPLAIADTSWILPGKTTFPWWNGNIISDSTIVGGNNFETNKYYIDFCAKYGIEFHSVVEYGGHEWYVNDGENFQPGPGADPTKPVPGLDMEKVCAYAKDNGVGIRLWVHWKALAPKLEEAFSLYARWGIKGLMVDFMDRDDQEMVTWQEEVLKLAAVHHLHIQFHGAYKPTGMHRTYPNEFTREGTLNYETNKWNDLATPDHDIHMPFTRLIAGAADYHLGGFRAVQKDDFRPNYIGPSMLGTRCHMLAMYVVLESYLGMVCDYPKAYIGEPGFEFIQQVPTTWDETRVLDAKVNEYIVIARRKGSQWFVGGITDSTPRTLTIPLDFAGKGRYRGILYQDNIASDNPNQLEEEEIPSSQSTVSVTLASGGGFAMVLSKD